MKKMLLIPGLFLGFNIYAQNFWAINGNTGAPAINQTNYVGHDRSWPLQISTVLNGTGIAQPILFQPGYNALDRGGLNKNKMIINGGVNGNTAMGNNLDWNFPAVDRLHLHHDNNSNVKIRFTNPIATTGSNVGLNPTGDFVFTQFETRNTLFFTPSNANFANSERRFWIANNGQIFIGSDIPAENVVDNTLGLGTFSQTRTSLLNIRGPINNTENIHPDNKIVKTILYSNCQPEVGFANNLDGFRMKLSENFNGRFNDALIFERVDGSTVPTNSTQPDGGTAFTNTGADNIEDLAFYIKGDGRSYFGTDKSRLGGLANRLTIDSETSDATRSGLRFVDLVSTATPVANPGNGVLSVDVNGNVIYVNNPSLNLAARNGLSVTAQNVELGQFDNNPAGPATLLNPRYIPMNDFDIYFLSGPGTGVSGKNSIGIGTENTLGKLHVNSTSASDATSLYISNSTIEGATGEFITVNGNNSASASALHNYGQKIEVTGASPTGTNQGTSYVITGGSEANGITIDVTGGTSNNLGIRSTVTAAAGAATSTSINAESNNAITNRAINALAVNGRDENTGVRARANRGTELNIGVDAEVSGTANDENLAIKAVATTEFGVAPIQTGVFAQAINGTAQSIGVNASASGPGANFGVFGEAKTLGASNVGLFGRSQFENSGINIAVLGAITNTDGPSMPPSITAGNWAGYFIGNVNIYGNEYVNSVLVHSDRRLKKDIKKLESTTDKIKKLNGYSYNMKTEEFKDKNFSKDEQLGLIAQEIKEVYPQLVKTDDKGYMAVNYDGMIPVLLEAIKEQQQQIDELKNLVKSMATGNETGSSKTTGQGVELSDKNVIVLDQNVPNPFAEHTVITYVVPANVQKAQIHFYNVNGVLIQSVEITERGNGKLNVFGENLTAGTYTYTLVADGKVITTKKMVKQ